MPKVGWVVSYGFCSKFHTLRFPAVQKFWKSVKIWQSYIQLNVGTFLRHGVYMMYTKSITCNERKWQCLLGFLFEYLLHVRIFSHCFLEVSLWQQEQLRKSLRPNVSGASITTSESQQTVHSSTDTTSANMSVLRGMTSIKIPNKIRDAKFSGLQFSYWYESIKINSAWRTWSLQRHCLHAA